MKLWWNLAVPSYTVNLKLSGNLFCFPIPRPAIPFFRLDLSFGKANQLRQIFTGSTNSIFRVDREDLLFRWFTLSPHADRQDFGKSMDKPLGTEYSKQIFAFIFKNTRFLLQRWKSNCKNRSYVLSRCIAPYNTRKSNIFYHDFIHPWASQRRNGKSFADLLELVSRSWYFFEQKNPSIHFPKEDIHRAGIF